MRESFVDPGYGMIRVAWIVNGSHSFPCDHCGRTCRDSFWRVRVGMPDTSSNTAHEWQVGEYCSETCVETVVAAKTIEIALHGVKPVVLRVTTFHSQGEHL